MSICIGRYSECFIPDFSIDHRSPGPKSGYNYLYVEMSVNTLQPNLYGLISPFYTSLPPYMTGALVGDHAWANR